MAFYYRVEIANPKNHMVDVTIEVDLNANHQTLNFFCQCGHRVLI